MTFKALSTYWRQILLWTLYLLIILGAVYRAIYIAEYNPIHQIWSDPQRHWEEGVNTLRDDPMTITDPVAYQLYISALAKLTFMKPPLVAFYTILLSVFMPWIWYRFFRELQPSKIYALIGYVVITWLPSWNSIYGYFMQETLMLPLLGAAMYFTWRCRRKKTLKSFLVMAFSWSLAGLTRSICIPLAVVATLWLWIEQGEKLKKATYTVLVLLLILGPLTYRSYKTMCIFAPYGIVQMTQIYAMSGAQKIVINYQRQQDHWFYHFTSPSLLIEPFAPLSTWKSKRNGTVFISVNIDEGEKAWKREIERHTLNLNEYLWITKENLILLFFSPSWPDSDRKRVLGEINYQMRWLWAPLGILVLTFSGVLWRKGERHLLLPSIILVWLFVQGFMPMAVNEGRYRKPFEGLIVAQIILLAGTHQRQWERKTLS